MTSPDISGQHLEQDIVPAAFLVTNLGKEYTEKGGTAGHSIHMWGALLPNLCLGYRGQRWS